MKKSNFALLGSALAASLAWSGAASAQETDPSGVDIIVTGEKTERSLRDTASSVVAASEADLNARGAFSTNDVLARVPNVVGIEPGNDAPAVRGVDGTGPASGDKAFYAGTRPRLNYQIDGRTLGFNEAIFLDSSIWDVTQVEVYRGPQSTLQGRNAIAGVVAVRTADPTFEWEGRARAIGGEYETRGLSGALSGPLIDNLLAFRLSADYQSRESTVDFTAYPQEDEPELYRTTTLRGKLLFTPNDDVRSTLTLSHVDGRAPQTELVLQPYSDRVAQSPAQPTFLSHTTSLISDTTWAISDTLTLQAYIAGTDFRVTRRSPAFQGNIEIDGDDLVFQPFLRFHPNDRLSGFIAAYIFRTDQDETSDIFGAEGFHDETESNALFGELEVRATDALTLTFGARYEEEERTRFSTNSPVLDFNETYREFLPRATISYRASENWTIGFTAGRGYNGGGAGFYTDPIFAPFDPPVVYSYEPEYVWNYEGFARGSLLDDRLTLTANIFYNDYEDFQLPFQLNPINPYSLVVRNAEQAMTYGLEAGANYEFAPRTAIYLNVGLLQTKVEAYEDPTIEGNDLPRSPAFTADLGFSLAPDEHWELHGDVRYTDTYYSDAFNDARGKTNPYAVVNAQIAYNLGPARLFVNGTNLFDNDEAIHIWPSAFGGLVPESATLLQPRTITGGIEFRF